MLARSVCAATAAAALFVAPGALAAGHEPKVGEPAPDASLVLVNGQKLHLSDLRGQVVIINFWATWCGPCRQELPLLDSYYRVTRDHGLRIFATTTEDSVPERYLHKLFDAMVIDPVHRFHGPYQPIGNAVPTNYVIDRTGIVRYAQAGAFDLDTLNRVVIPLLNESAPPASKTAAS